METNEEQPKTDLSAVGRKARETRRKNERVKFDRTMNETKDT